MSGSGRPRRRLRVPLVGLAAGERELPADAARYVARIHRLGVGDRFVAFDPAGRLEADGEVTTEAPAITGAARRGARRAAAGLRVVVRLGEPRPARLIAARQVTLIQAIGKGAKVDAIVRDATELGATRLVVAPAERSIRRPRSLAAQLERWQRIAVEAARQCGRGDAPEIAWHDELEAALEQLAPQPPTSVGLCLEPAGSLPFGDALVGLGPSAAVVLVVGPEGGLTSAELDLARQRRFELVTLGPFVLRTETVCAAALGALLAWAAPSSRS